MVKLTKFNPHLRMNYHICHFKNPHSIFQKPSTYSTGLSK